METETNQDLRAMLDEYEEAKRTIKEAEKTVSELKPKIVELLPDQPVSNGTAKFYMKQGKSTWVYSEELQARQEQISKDQKEEQQTGVATKKQGAPYLECSLSK